MASKFVLNTGQLDTDYLSTPATLILDSTQRGLLDANLLSSGIPIIVNDVATSHLGNLSATVQSTPIVLVSGSATLGAINSIAQVSVSHLAQGTASFGQITANANTLPTIFPTFDATLNGLISTTNTIVTKVVTATSSLGSLNANINALPIVDVVAKSLFGKLTASAQSSIPPQPSQPYGSKNGYYQVKNKKKLEQPAIKPVIINYEIEPLEPLIKTVFGNAVFNSGIFSAQGQSQIDFSTIQDEADLLLIL